MCRSFCFKLSCVEASCLVNGCRVTTLLSSLQGSLGFMTGSIELRASHCLPSCPGRLHLYGPEPLNGRLLCKGSLGFPIGLTEPRASHCLPCCLWAIAYRPRTSQLLPSFQGFSSCDNWFCCFPCAPQVPQGAPSLLLLALPFCQAFWAPPCLLLLRLLLLLPPPPLALLLLWVPALLLLLPLCLCACAFAAVFAAPFLLQRQSHHLGSLTLPGSPLVFQEARGSQSTEALVGWLSAPAALRMSFKTTLTALYMFRFGSWSLGLCCQLAFCQQVAACRATSLTRGLLPPSLTDLSVCCHPNCLGRASLNVRGQALL